MKALPEYEVGHNKLMTPSPIEIPFELILEDYEKEDNVEPSRHFPSGGTDYSSSTDSSGMPSWLKPDVNPEEILTTGSPVKTVATIIYE